MYDEKEGKLHISVKTNNPERTMGILKAIDFNDRQQLALLLWPKVRDRKLSCFEASKLAGMTRDELEDFYMEADLSEYQMTRDEMKKERENLNRVLEKT